MVNIEFQGSQASDVKLSTSWLSVECRVPNVNHIHPNGAYFRGFSSQTHLNVSPMITFDHLGESYVLTFYISYTEDNACFKFRGYPFVSKFSSFSYLRQCMLLYVLVNFYLFLLCFLLSLFWNNFDAYDE